jgi:hypothetical protein
MMGMATPYMPPRGYLFEVSGASRAAPVDIGWGHVNFVTESVRSDEVCAIVQNRAMAMPGWAIGSVLVRLAAVW